ncbi:uncharacterized protein RCC_11517 [Ramularia collo-cygni]|uniref:WSC domain-containing protein n=1 Tax=Ramularia collo-cygni TaxID=112498 RepID=A0A2D3VCC6_9PEZI|nr:uncharacterized protein RCC_11517 [Ramularia collo-cygni]CZT25848.1 uncharacterized protein RCC_11517 [Ramularia collo-cygni]
MRSSSLLALAALPLSFTKAQQYAGDIISAFLPTIVGAEVAFFRIPDPSGQNNNLTLINYYSHRSDGSRIIESDIQRAIIVPHGLLRDPWNYENDMINALKVAQAKDAGISPDSVAILAPYFPNGNDKGLAYPWTEGLRAGRGSTSNALVWSGSQWSAGANNAYPHSSRNTSSFFVLDTLVKYFDDATLFPNLNQIVIAGHSMGGQMVQRYAAVSPYQETRVPITHWIGNPDSYAWLDPFRPLSNANCPDYDDYRSGYNNFEAYAGGDMTYGVSIVNQGRAAIQANYRSKQIAYARALLDRGDHSSDCGANTTGLDRHERFFFYIKSFTPTCDDPAGYNCDTVDLINVSHDNGQMYNSPAGQARIFTDNFYGEHGRAYDFGYPRLQSGDDPFPDPVLVNTPPVVNAKVYANGMSYQGCWTDQAPTTVQALPTLLYNDPSNTIDSCTTGCANGGFTIAGVKNGGECWCGNALAGASAVLTVDSVCRFPCPGDASQICGADQRFSIFSTGFPAFA